MADTVIRAGIAYNFYAVPYSIPAIKKLDKKIIALHKTICGIPRCTSNITTQLPHNLFGIEAFSLQNAPGVHRSLHVRVYVSAHEGV